MNVPPLSNVTWKEREREAGKAIENVAKHSVAFALEKEMQATVEG
jgi:hypothetical protein